jgi:hypothetical protein
MTLDEFTHKLNGEITEFRRDWIDGSMLESSELYPDELDSDQWIEQILIRLQNRDW